MRALNTFGAFTGKQTLVSAQQGVHGAGGIMAALAEQTATIQRGIRAIRMAVEDGVLHANRGSPPFPYTIGDVEIESRKGECKIMNTVVLYFNTSDGIAPIDDGPIKTNWNLRIHNLRRSIVDKIGNTISSTNNVVRITIKGKWYRSITSPYPSMGYSFSVDYHYASPIGERVEDTCSAVYASIEQAVITDGFMCSVTRGYPEKETRRFVVTDTIRPHDTDKDVCDHLAEFRQSIRTYITESGKKKHTVYVDIGRYMEKDHNRVVYVCTVTV